MWFFDKLKSIGQAILNAVSALNFFGNKELPKKVEPLRYAHQKPIKHIVIPVAPLSPTNKEILRTIKPQPHPYSNRSERPGWVNNIYRLCLSGEIKADNLKQELDAHRLLESAKLEFCNSPKRG